MKNPGFVEQIIDRLRALGPRPVLGEFRDGERLDVAGDALEEQIRRARAGLRRAGVRRGDRVALIAPSSSRWVAVDLAVMCEGAISVPLYDRLPAGDVGRVLADCRPRVAVVADEALVRALRASLAWPCAWLSIATVLEAPATGAPPVRLSPGSTVTIVYTSGSSGEPKGVVLTRANFDHVVRAVGERLAEILPPGRHDRVYHFLPLGFVPSRLMLWAHLARGAPVVLAGDLTRFADELRCVNPRYFLAVPLVLARLMRSVEVALERRGRVAWWLFRRARAAHARLAREQGSRFDQLLLDVARIALLSRVKASIAPDLELIVCGSAPLGGSVQRFFSMIGVPVYQGYGLTETAGVVTLERPEAARVGGAGTPVEGCEVRLGERGEVLCRGPNVFAGYWGRPAASAEVLRDGWLHTGDRGDMDADGGLRITGRVRDLLVLASGHNVQPEPLEQDVLDACPGLEQAMVVGHGRPFLGVVVSGPTDERAIVAGLAALNATLPHYRRVHRFHRAAEPFSLDNGLLTANGKLRRGAIEACYGEAIDAFYRAPRPGRGAERSIPTNARVIERSRRIPSDRRRGQSPAGRAGGTARGG